MEGRGWLGATKCQVTEELSNFQGGCPIGYKLSQNIAKSMAISLTSCVVISSKVAACTRQLVAFSGHSSTLGHLTGLRNKPQKK